MNAIPGLVALCLLCLCCQGGRPVSPAPGSADARIRRNVTVSGVAVAGAGLDLRAFVADMAFVFPQESAELTRSLVRTELARLEAQRLGMEIPAARVEAAFEAFTDQLMTQLGSDTTLDAWAQDRHGLSWSAMRPLYRRHLADNLLYQVVLRADAYLSGRVGMFWFVSADEGQARSWAASLESGRDPKTLVSESLLPGPEADGSYPATSRDLPGAAGELLRQARVGQVVGPLQLPGDRSWRVGIVNLVLPPVPEPPPVEALLEELEGHPIAALEARAWFEKMSSRYTASTELSPFSGPTRAFEFLR